MMTFSRCGALVVAGLVAGPVVHGLRAEPPTEDLASLAAASESLARAGRSVRVRGTVAYSDPAWRILFLTNGREALLVDPAEASDLPAVGTPVRVDGVTSFAVGLPAVSRPRITPEAAGAPLSPLPPGRSPAPARFATIRGVVRQAQEGIERDRLVLASGKTRHTVFVLGPRRGALPPRGAEVDVSGVVVEAPGPLGTLGLPTILASSRDALETVTPAPDPTRLETLSLVEAARAWNRGEVGRLRRVRGIVVDRKAGDRHVIEDATGRLEIATDRPAVSQGTELEFTGFLSSDSAAPLLQDVASRMRGSKADTHRRDATLSPITSLAALRALSAREAERGHPVRVDAVVTFVDLAESMLFVQDGSDAVFVSPADGFPKVDPGQRLRIVGWSAPGKLVPIIVEPKVEILAQGVRLEATPMRLSRMAIGEDDCRFVVATGLVRSVRWLSGRTTLHVDVGEGTITAAIPSSEGRLTSDIVDARVRIRGVATSLFNWRGQLTQMELNVAKPEFVEVVKAKSRPPLDASAVAARDVLRPAALGRARERVRVRAVVTALEPRGRLFVRDDTSPLSVLLPDPIPLQPGDIVDAAGYPTASGHSAVLEDAVVRVATRGAAPVPVEVSEDALREGLYDSDLVSLQATLLHSARTSDGLRLFLHSGDVLFDAVLGPGLFPETRALPDRGSRLRVQGVVLSHEATSSSSRGFSLLMRSASDVTILARPPLWSEGRGLEAILVTLVILGGALSAVAWRRARRRQASVVPNPAGGDLEIDLRYREALEALAWERTQELEQAQAELVKRERLATLGRLTATVSHELRNPLGTIRGSLFVIGNAVRGHSAGVDRALERAERNILRCDTIIEELHEYTRVRDLLPQSTELDTWLGELLDELPVPAGLLLERRLESKVVVRIDRGRIQRCLVNLVANACEALTASASHAAERLPAAAHDRLVVATSRTASKILISVSDNGPGISDADRGRIFEPFFSTKSFGIGLGLAIVRQISEQHGGGVTLETEPGRRTTFILWLPSALVEGPSPPRSASEGGP